MRLIALFCLLAAASCKPSYHTLYHYELRATQSGNKELKGLVESYYITLENPENNRPNEQDSLLSLIHQQLKKKQ